MSLYSGSASSGTYRYQTTLSAGSHTYYFDFSDGVNTVRLPSSGSYSGPTVSSQPPAAPTLSSPADGATGLSSPVTLSWSASSGWVVGYTVYGWRVDTGATLYDLLPAFQTWDMRPLLARPGIYESAFV